ncbi:MAG: ribosome biogenesis factor YjgA [Pseudomonadota bacterium]|nr:ribosome biogenesis factor YjgA [Pseudomonadota bacterium]MEC9223581.1 ribosome biogenesis factor YjgA [Pseudomonadota bacterium]
MDREKNSLDQHRSKTQRKKDALALQSLGDKLTNFTPSQLSKLPLTEAVIVAIGEYNLLPKKHGARKRQLQLIGRLMRSCDYEVVSLAIEKLPRNDAQAPKDLRNSRDLSEKILTEGNAEINAAIKEHGNLDRQKLRRLYREYYKGSEAQQQKIRSKLANYLANNSSK